MSLVIYSLVLAVLILASIYGLVVYFSHTPRAPLPIELKYTTNDGSDVLYDLPKRITRNSEYKDEGIDLSLVIPCYNETERLGVMLDDSVNYLKDTFGNRFEILIVDDGSSDQTAEYALAKANELGLAPHIMRVVKLSKNRGKGGAVTHGLLHIRGKYGLFADADGATTFKDSASLYKYLDTLDDQEPGVAIGSRAHMVNTDAVVKRSFIRNFLMYGLHTLVFVFGIRDIKDTQCGFKMFNYEAIKCIFPQMHTERWIFDVEVLLLSELQNIKIKELSVNWQEVDGSKVDLAKDSIGMAVDLVVTRLAYILGIYKLAKTNGLSKKNQ